MCQIATASTVGNVDYGCLQSIKAENVSINVILFPLFCMPRPPKIAVSLPVCLHVCASTNCYNAYKFWYVQYTVSQAVCAFPGRIILRFLQQIKYLSSHTQCACVSRIFHPNHAHTLASLIQYWGLIFPYSFAIWHLREFGMASLLCY